MLDAILAMVLTLAALATVATIIMEACLRTARMRKKNLAQVMALLNQELGKGPLGLNPEQRTQFISGVMRNPAQAISDKLCKKIEASDPEELLAFIGYDRDPEKGRIANAARQFFMFMGQIVGDGKRAGLYDSVSMEHVLRRLVEVEAVQRRAREAGDSLKTELNRLARKYEEFGSAVSAGFKRHAQAWSVAAGVVLALAANIDGVRIFEAYLQDADLAQAVIAKQEDLEAYQEAASGRQQEFKEAVARFETARKELAAARTGADEQAVAAAEKELQKAEESLIDLASPEKIQQELEDATRQLDELVALGVPLGWKLYPNCPYGEPESRWKAWDPKCRDLKAVGIGAEKNRVKGNEPGAGSDSESENAETRRRWVIGSVLLTARHDTGGFIRWLFAVILTGLLIGLGAPFWFDVAKRLAKIRTGVRAAASSEYRMSAKNADGDAGKRREIVDNVVADAAGERQEPGVQGELARQVADAEINKQSV